jgi:hypothetical protein
MSVHRAFGNLDEGEETNDDLQTNFGGAFYSAALRLFFCGVQKYRRASHPHGWNWRERQLS